MSRPTGEVAEDDGREECPEGIYCGVKSNILHNRKYKHVGQPQKAKEKAEEPASEDDEREECPDGLVCSARYNTLHRRKFKHLHPAGQVKEGPRDYDASGGDKPPPSDDDEREECPEGTGCGMRTNVMHRRKYKHLLPTVEASKRPEDYERISDDDEREECPEGTACEKRKNGRHHAKYKHVMPTKAEKKYLAGGAKAGSVSGAEPEEPAREGEGDVPPPSDDDEREECPEGTGCGMRTNVLHRGKYKHIKRTLAAGKRPRNYEDLSEDDEREECPEGTACEKRKNGRHRGKYKHIKVTRPQEKRSTDETLSDDDEREECADGTACKVRTNILHRQKYKHVRISRPEEIAVNEESSEDDEREECPEGVSCKVRTNVLHRGKYKHIRKANVPQKRAAVPRKADEPPNKRQAGAAEVSSGGIPAGGKVRQEQKETSNEILSEDDERHECPDGTACKVRTNILHRGKYKHIRVSSTEEIGTHEEPSDDDEREECPDGTGCKVRSNILHRGKYKHIRKAAAASTAAAAPRKSTTENRPGRETRPAAAQTQQSADPATKRTDDVPEPSDDDDRIECPDGTGCGMRTNILHRSKYKHLRPTAAAGTRSAVANPPSDDDERAECPGGTACEKRPNPRHRSVYKHVTVTGPISERPKGPDYIVTEPPSDDDERDECPEGTSCRIRTNTLHRGKYKHTVTHASDYELPEEDTEEEEPAGGKRRPRNLPDRHAGKRSEYDRDDMAMIRDMDRELGPEPYAREPVDPDYVPEEAQLPEHVRQ